VGGIGSNPVEYSPDYRNTSSIRKLNRKRGFQRDLYYRINVVAIDLPPLRERREDIAKLADFFLQKLSRRTGRRAPKLTVQALTAMLAYNWPGNIRELENVMGSGVSIPVTIEKSRFHYYPHNCLTPKAYRRKAMRRLGIMPPAGSLKDQLNAGREKHHPKWP